MWITNEFIHKPNKETMNEYMRAAFSEALKAYKIGEVPVGCVIEKDGKIIGRGHNLVEKSKLATRHAEIIAIEEACKNLDSWRITGSNIYITLEPCTMCIGAILHARIKDIHIGALDPNRGSAISKIPVIAQDLIPNRSMLIIEESEACSYILSRFFRKLRRTNENIYVKQEM